MNYFKTVLVLLILAVIILGLSACITKSPNQEIAGENSVDNSTNETARFTETNESDNTSLSPVSIPLEKPPFID